MVCLGRDQLSEAESIAEKDKIEAANRFRSWAMARVPHAKYMNVNSDIQVLFSSKNLTLYFC